MNKNQAASRLGCQPFSNTRFIHCRFANLIYTMYIVVLDKYIRGLRGQALHHGTLGILDCAAAIDFIHDRCVPWSHVERSV